MTHSVSNTRAFALLLATVCIACDPPPSHSVDGELRRGRFHYACVEDTDAVCPGFGDPDDFPDVFGVGGRFAVTYRAESSDVVGITVEASSSDVIELDDDVFTWRVTGQASLLALQDGEVYDFLNLRGVAVDHVRLEGVSPDGDLELEAGRRRVLGAMPQDEHGRRIGGALEYQWSIADPEVAIITSDTFLEEVTIRAVRSGTTHVMVEVAGYEQAVPIVVGPPSRNACDRAELDTDDCQTCWLWQGATWEEASQRC